ncbi:MAG TPA: RDD family protein, partial [Actinomycetota bacterium]|nr:RDD family protein [Actinomycetota bacterium]
PSSPVVEVSPWGRRFAAWVIDSILLGIVPTALLFFRMLGAMSDAGLLDPNRPPPSTLEMQEQINQIYSGMAGEITLIGFVFAIIGYLYYVLMHGTVGKTLGKMAVGIKVIKADGTPCDMAAAAKRGVVHPLGSGVPMVGFAVLMLNGLWPLWDEKHQSLGDKVGGTYVVRKQPTVMPVAELQQPPAAPSV